MSTPPPRLKSLTDPTHGPRPAIRPAVAPAVGDLRGAAEGVPTVLLPDRHTPAEPDQHVRVVGWMHVICPPDWRVTPSGRAWCACGYRDRATGRPDTGRLVRDYLTHRDTCPLHTADEGRAAA